jgi:hypothetical protein
MLLTEKYKNVVVCCPFCGTIKHLDTIKRHLTAKKCIQQQDIIKKTNTTLNDKFSIYLNALQKVYRNANLYGELDEKNEKYKIVCSSVLRVEQLKKEIYGEINEECKNNN